MKKKHPMQPVVWDGKGVIRFQENPIVAFLLEWASGHGMNLNDLERMSARMRWTENDWQHFAQLHGYSVDGWGSLRYVRDKVWEKAVAKQEALLEQYPEDPETVNKAAA